MTELTEIVIGILEEPSSVSNTGKVAKAKKVVEDLPTKTIIESYIDLVRDFQCLSKQNDARQMRGSAGGVKIAISKEQFECHFRIIGEDGRGRRVGSKNGVRKDAEEIKRADTNEQVNE